MTSDGLKASHESRNLTPMKRAVSSSSLGAAFLPCRAVAEEKMARHPRGHHVTNLTHGIDIAQISKSLTNFAFSSINTRLGPTSSAINI